MPHATEFRIFLMTDTESSVVVVTDPNDPRLQPFRALKDVGCRANGLFIAESELVIERIIESGWALHLLLLTPERLPRIQAVIPDHVSTYIADQALVDNVIGFPLHRGAVGLVKRPNPVNLDALLAASKNLLVLEGVIDPANVGAIFRHADAFGVDGVILSRSAGDPLFRKSVRSSMGSVLRVPFCQVPDSCDLMAELRNAGFLTVASTPNPEAESVRTFSPDANSRVALFVGSETNGLDHATLARCHVRIRIPMARDVDSLNAATASAIVLYQLFGEP